MHIEIANMLHIPQKRENSPSCQCTDTVGVMTLNKNQEEKLHRWGASGVTACPDERRNNTRVQFRICMKTVTVTRDDMACLVSNNGPIRTGQGEQCRIAVNNGRVRYNLQHVNRLDCHVHRICPTLESRVNLRTGDQFHASSLATTACKGVSYTQKYSPNREIRDKFCRGKMETKLENPYIIRNFSNPI